MKNLVLVDGHSLAYRMYFALERTQMHTADRFPTWGVYGFFKALFDLLKQERQIDGIAIAFDVSRESFRTELYPDYKAHRKAMPDSLRQQLSKIREGIDLLGIPVFEVENYEADDLIGTLAKQAADGNVNVTILTGDQDAFQIIDDDTHISVLLPGFQGGLKRYGKQEVYDKLGIYPDQVTDFKGLKGDSSDNIPGVPGIGDKTAAKLLAEYQNLENVLAHTEEVAGNKLKQSLITYKDQAILSKKLATILYDAPVSFSAEACHLKVPHLDDFLKFLAEMEFKSLLNQRDTILKPFLGGSSTAQNGNGKPAQLNLLAAPQDTDAPKTVMIQDYMTHYQVPFKLITEANTLADFLEKVKQTGVMAIDIETSGLDCLTATFAGIALSWSPKFLQHQKAPKNILKLKEFPSKITMLTLNKTSESKIETIYIPLDHPGLETDLSVEDVLTQLKPVLEDPHVVKIIHNVKYETNVFRHHKIELQGLLFDTMIASYVLNPDRRHGLKALAHDVLGHRMQEINELIGKGKSQVPFTEVPVETAAPYAACDTHVTLELAEKFIHALDEGLESLLYEVELPVVSALAEMEWNGISLDCEYLKTLSHNLEEMVAAVEKDVFAMAGVTFNLNSPKQVGEVLFEKLKIPTKGYTPTKSAFSTNAKVLESLSVEYPVVQKLLDYRQLFKLKSTYIDTLPKLINPVDQRLHTSFNQTVASTGRLSSSDPNLQNIPIRSELGRSIRMGFVPRDRKDWSILSADYSQIELRLLAHFFPRQTTHPRVSIRRRYPQSNSCAGV